MENILHIPERSHTSDEQRSRPYSQEDLLLLEGQIAAISYRLVKTPAEQLDQAIIASFETLCCLLGVGRGGLLEVAAEQPVARVTHAWYAEGVETVSEEINLAEVFPWCYHKLVNEQKTLAISSIAHLPEGAELDQQAFLHLKVTSNLAIPLCVSGRIHHLIVVHAIEKEVLWQKEFIVRLRLVGEIFVSALRQREVVSKLLISENRLHLAATSAEAGIWEFNITTRRVWASSIELCSKVVFEGE
ncbi:GAF domain-containing protein, partial [Desulfopila aestuarii DSM 18488]